MAQLESFLLFIFYLYFYHSYYFSHYLVFYIVAIYSLWGIVIFFFKIINICNLESCVKQNVQKFASESKQPLYCLFGFCHHTMNCRALLPTAGYEVPHQGAGRLTGAAENVRANPSRSVYCQDDAGSH